jgi:hypothetical protein
MNRQRKARHKRRSRDLRWLDKLAAGKFVEAGGNHRMKKAIGVKWTEEQKKADTRPAFYCPEIDNPTRFYVRFLQLDDVGKSIANGLII